MAMSVKMMRLFNAARAAAGAAKQEKRILEKRWAHYQKIRETLRGRQDERMALLGLSWEEIEARIRSGKLNRTGIQMFLDQVPGGSQGIDKLPGELPKLASLLEKEAFPEDSSGTAESPGERKTRVKFHL